jgi:MoaA/NifB/PqqE/SkfB family radical SAM enzyme
LKEKKWQTQVNSEGRLIIPPDLVSRLGLIPGTRVCIKDNGDDIRVLRPASFLAKVYIEPTNTCNLDCLTCIRNVWDEPSGVMNLQTYDRILEGIKANSPTPEVFFGGFGEPLSHPRIIQMVRQAKEAGAQVELITNGILLDDRMSAALIEARLDTLWVSIDGAIPESYADVRLGAALPQVLNNIQRLRQLRNLDYHQKPVLGLAFVAMKRNIHELPDVLRLGLNLGVNKFSVSNVLAYTADLRKEVLYDQAMYGNIYQVAGFLPSVNLPLMDVNDMTLQVLNQVLRGSYGVSLVGQNALGAVDSCPFIQKNSTSIRWDGAVCPCLSLLHTHESYLDHHLRVSKAYLVGNINELTLSEIWMDPAYINLRERLQNFDFSPCTYCNSCEMSYGNDEDCFGSPTPACGGCLWAQGLIQCP